jgi:hypothetical protein
MEFLVVLAVLAVLALFVTRPLWRSAGERPSRESSDEIADLEAARDAKYLEIREAELDHRGGKLSEEDFRAVDQALRAEAIEILRALDRARERVNGRATSEQLPSERR